MKDYVEADITTSDDETAVWREWFEESRPAAGPVNVKPVINGKEHDGKLIDISHTDNDLNLAPDEIAVQFNGGQIHILKVKSDDNE
jgi:hypothetical protein